MKKTSTLSGYWLSIFLFFFLIASPSIQRLAAQDAREILESRRLDASDLNTMTTAFFVPKTPKMQPMIFGNLNDTVKGTALPVAVIHSVENGWLFLKPDIFYENHAWIYAGVTDQTGQIWLVLQPFTSGFAMSPTKKYLFFVSDDQGLTFRQGASLDIPSAFSEIRRLTVEKNRIEITLYAPDGDTEKPGYYTFRSKDNGKTWSKPDYDPNFLHDPIFDNQTTVQDLMQGLLGK